MRPPDCYGDLSRFRWLDARVVLVLSVMVVFEFSGTLFSIDPEQATISLQNGMFYNFWLVVSRSRAFLLTNFADSVMAQC
jgi:hypothetical protein